MPIINECPVGCIGSLVASNIILPEGPLLQCKRCGQIVSSCDNEDYRSRFQPFDENHPIDRNPHVHAKRLKRVQKYAPNGFPQKKTILDIGCNIGTFLGLAKAAGYLTLGVEPDTKAVQEGTGSGLDIRCGYLHDLMLPDSSYDIITLFEVIEHLDKPIELLGECHRILKKEGVLFITTGNTSSWTVKWRKQNWDYFDLKLGHISFFNPLSMTVLARHTDFEAVKIETRSVSLRDKASASRVEYRIAKIAAEALSLPARLLGSGHDMFVVLKKAV
jgi:2-polyprenyl-3-methyl-5-hydroxy-6-metoxy-1,4-benzoquinol methylase